MAEISRIEGFQFFMPSNDHDPAHVLTATHARFMAETRQLEIIFNNGAEYRWPVDSLEMLVFKNDE